MQTVNKTGKMNIKFDPVGDISQYSNIMARLWDIMMICA